MQKINFLRLVIAESNILHKFLILLDANILPLKQIPNLHKPRTNPNLIDNTNLIGKKSKCLRIQIPMISIHPQIIKKPSKSKKETRSYFQRHQCEGVAQGGPHTLQHLGGNQLHYCGWQLGGWGLGLWLLRFLCLLCC